MFYSQDGEPNFDAVIMNTNTFKSFKEKAKLLENPAANGNNWTWKNLAIAVPLKYLSNFWQSLEMPLINCRSELKLRCTKQCFLASAVVENNNADSSNIIFNIKDTKPYVLAITLSTKDN